MRAVDITCPLCLVFLISVNPAEAEEGEEGKEEAAGGAGVEEERAGAASAQTLGRPHR